MYDTKYEILKLYFVSYIV